MRKEECIEELLKSVKIGLVLFFSAVISLMLNHDMVHLELFSEKIFLIVGIYIGVVIIIRLMLSSKIIRKISFLFSGAAIVWWSFLIYFIVSTISQFLVDYVRNIVIMHLAIALCAVLGNYLYMRYVSKELNEGEWKKKLVLLEDLEQKPRNEDEFMECIISYCKKNALDLEVFQYGIPAKVKMGDELYEVKLVEYCSLSNGIVSALEFRLTEE